MYFNKNKIDKNQVVVNAVSDTLNVSRITTNKFENHSRSIINFHNYGNIGIIALYIDITLKNKSGQSYDSVTPIYVVVYDVRGHQNDVDPRVFDSIYRVETGKMQFQGDNDMDNHDITNVNNVSVTNLLNMNNKQIKSLQDGNEDDDAVNIKQFTEMENNLNFYRNDIGKVNPVIRVNNNTNLINALLNYILKK